MLFRSKPLTVRLQATMVQDWPRELFPRHQSFSHGCYSDNERQQPQQHQQPQTFTTNRFNQSMQRQPSFQQDRYQINGTPNDLNRRQPLMVSLCDKLGRWIVSLITARCSKSMKHFGGTAALQERIISWPLQAMMEAS